MAVILRACKRCGGDLVPDRWDRYGRTLTCLQCGTDVTPSRLQPEASMNIMKAEGSLSGIARAALATAGRVK